MNLATLPTLPANLPPIESAPLPAVYEQAKTALAQCAKMDECQAWANKAEALASYARQAADDSLRKLADRIQSRAIRRCGELYRSMPISHDRGNQYRLREGALPQPTRTQAAEQAGISEWQRKTALRVASIPEPVFEAMVESDSPPTVTQLAELGKQSRAPIESPHPVPVVVEKPVFDLGGINPLHFPRATELQGSLKRLKEFCEKNDPSDIAKAFKLHEIQPLKDCISLIENWIDRFIVQL